MDINPQTANFSEYGKQVRVIRGDVSQFDDVMAAMANAKPSRVINLAYWLGSEHPPRVAFKLHGRTRVEMAVSVPEGKKLDHVDLFLNQTRMASLYGPPNIGPRPSPESRTKPSNHWPELPNVNPVPSPAHRPARRTQGDAANHRAGRGSRAAGRGSGPARASTRGVAPGRHGAEQDCLELVGQAARAARHHHDRLAAGRVELQRARVGATQAQQAPQRQVEPRLHGGRRAQRREEVGDDVRDLHGPAVMAARALYPAGCRCAHRP
jgi:hypothetical protein